MVTQKNVNILSWWWLIIVAGIAIYLGVVGFIQHADINNKPPLTILDALYLALQLFPMDSGSQLGIIPIKLEFARWLAVLTTFSAAIKAIWALVTKQTKSALHLKKINGHAIICGAGIQGFHIARQLIEFNNQQVVVIDNNPDNPYLAKLEALGAIILVADASSIEIISKAKINTARYLISSTENDITNIDIIEHAKSLKDNDKRLDCYAHIRDLNTRTLFYNHGLFSDSKKEFNARIFNMYDLAARLLFDEYAPDIFKPITQQQDPAASILIFGFTPLTQSVILYAAKTGFFANKKNLQITIVDQDIEAKLNSLYLVYPKLKEVLDLKSKTLSTETISSEDIETLLNEQPNIIYLCMEYDIKALTLAERMVALLANKTTPVVVSLSQHDKLYALLTDDNKTEKARNINLFPLLDKTSHVDIVISEQQDKIAKTIHHLYCEDQIKTGDTREKNPTLIPWDDLSEGIKESNRGQADHLAIKLRAIGLDLKTVLASSNVLKFSDQQIYTLAEMEHQRWIAGKILDGWKSTKGKKDLANKLSPLLIDFDQLPDEERHKDEQTVKLHINQLLLALRDANSQL